MFSPMTNVFGRWVWQVGVAGGCGRWVWQVGITGGCGSWAWHIKYKYALLVLEEARLQ